MPHLYLYDDGDTVVTYGQAPVIVAQIVSRTNASVTVDTHNISNGKRERTQWSPQTVVRKYFPPKQEEPQTQETAPSQPTPAKPIGRPAEKTPKAEKGPKPKPEVDAFGVRKGSMASKVNEFLLQKRKGITVQDVLDNVEGSKRDNVTSHLRRMVGDKLLINKGEGRSLLVSVPKGVK